MCGHEQYSLFSSLKHECSESHFLIIIFFLVTMQRERSSVAEHICPERY